MAISKSLPILFLWHHHQPCYRMPGSDCALLPWVRLHAARGYTDMAAACEHEGAHVTFNFTPVLLEQIDEQAKAPVADEFERVSRIPVGDLTEDERCFILEYFFSANWETLVYPIPRYAELLTLRGEETESTEIREKAGQFSDGDLRDLTVLFHLVWMGFTARKLPEIRGLFKKGRDFTDEDREIVLGVHRQLLQAVIPTYRRLWDSGLIELSTSPFAHPILPLLCDSRVASVELPEATLPQTPFCYPEDAKGQLNWARKVFKKHFGKLPIGLWPSEGSISEEALMLIGAEGFRWAASDEENLYRSQIEGRHPDDAFEPFKFQKNGQEIKLFFRDKKLSDAIGFQYARNPTEDSIKDFHSILLNIEETTQDRPNRCAVIILDGENPWEYFPDGGEAFLHGLYAKLNSDSKLFLSTFSEHLENVENPNAISGIHSGSWIDANFRIWIGDCEKNRAWDLLRNMRKRLAELSRASLENDEVRRALYFAEGSDWFWWFGEPFHSSFDSDFDQLFRGFLRQAFEAAGLESPSILDTPIAQAALLEASRQPTFEMTPTLDGRVTSFYEWVGAISLDTREFGATMGQTERVIQKIHYGFDLSAFHLRIDFTDGSWQDRDIPFQIKVELFGDTSTFFAWSLVKGCDQVPVSVVRELGGAAARLSHARCAANDIVEISIPLREADLKPGSECSFAVMILEDDFLRERIPREGILRFEIFSPQELAAHWMT